MYSKSQLVDICVFRSSVVQGLQWFWSQMLMLLSGI